MFIIGYDYWYLYDAVLVVHILGLGVWVLMLSIRYEHKKWVPRDGKAKSPPRVSEEKNSVYRARPETSSQHGHVKETERFFEKQKGAHPPSASNRAPQQVNVVLFVFPLKSMDN